MEEVSSFWSMGADGFWGAIPKYLSSEIILVTAILLDGLIGDPRWFWKGVPHPVVLIGNLIGFLDKRLNREDRSPMDRRIRGGITVGIVVGTVIGFAMGLQALLSGVQGGWMIECLLVAILLAARSLHDHVRRVGKGLRQEGLDGGRREIAHIVSRDPRSLDRHGVARSAIESLAENYSDGVVAPILFYLVFGLPGILAYKAINTLDSMIAYKTPRHRDFGQVAARLDDLANWIPARLSALILCLAACFTPTAYPVAACRTALREAGNHKSPNAGWPEAALAGALNIALGGPRRYSGGDAVGVWIGADYRARLEPRDIDRARTLYIIANYLQWFAILMIGVSAFL